MDLVKNVEHFGISDLPEEMINEIILLVPVIDLFRVSKVSRLFKKLCYNRIISISDKEEYQKGVNMGDILSLINCSVSYGDIELYRMCKKGYIDIARFLISKGTIDLDEGLSFACAFGHMEIVQLLIKHGADEWNLGLIDACDGNHMDIVQLMLQLGATDLSYAFIELCEKGNTDTVKVVIEKDKSFLSTNLECCLTPDDWDNGLMAACHGGHFDIVKLITERRTEYWLDLYKSINKH